MNEERDKRLFSHTPNSYSGEYESHLLEQYKLYVQSADNLSARRVSSNNFLLTLNSAIIALYGINAAFAGIDNWILGIPFGGLLASLVWYMMIRSHRNLNDVKFTIISDLEKHLPVRLYTHEWKLAKGDNPNAYLSVTDIERWIPVLYAALHIAFIGVQAALLVRST